MPNYWLVKTEPSVYAWEQLHREGKTSWEGIRNYQARNSLRDMRLGDLVFIYHSGEERMIVGIGRVCSLPYPDPTAPNSSWLTIDIEAVQEMARPVSLEEIKRTHPLHVMALATHSRLSVQPVTVEQWQAILRIGKTSI